VIGRLIPVGRVTVRTVEVVVVETVDVVGVVIEEVPS
jgi:hypothetical protein